MSLHSSCRPRAAEPNSSAPSIPRVLSANAPAMAVPRSVSVRVCSNFVDYSISLNGTLPYAFMNGGRSAIRPIQSPERLPRVAAH